MIARLLSGFIAGLLTLPSFALDVDKYHLIDLSHSYSAETLYWPTSPSKFERTELSYGETESGYFYSAFSFCTPEHGGTHLDAPQHFAAHGLTADSIPLNNLIAPAVVIDVTRQAEANRNYLLSAEDVGSFEGQHGRIPTGVVVLLRTGWSRHWPDANDYLGDDTPGDAGKLQFPSFGEDAARLLVEERHIAMLGVDTASIDFGKSQDFAVHRIAAASNVSGLENLTNLDKLPPTGSLIVALPMKIKGGSGAPVRVVALVPK